MNKTIHLSDQELEEAIYKIDGMFKSRDKSMVKLGQVMCHQLRLSYYVWSFMFRLPHNSLRFSMFSDGDSFGDSSGLYAKHYINLSCDRKKKMS